MVKYNKANVKLSDSQLNKLKMLLDLQTEATLRMHIRMFNGNNLPRKLLLTTRQKTKLRLCIWKYYIKFSKTQISRIIQFGVCSGSLLNKLAGPLIKIAVPIAKTISTPLGVTAAASVIDAGI